MMRVLFSAHDPGGANAVLPIVRELQRRGDTVQGILGGPALVIFERALIPCKKGEGWSERQIKDLVEEVRPDIFLGGTSAGDTVDKKILLLLKDTPSVYVLDFWSNYWDRFPRGAGDFGDEPSVICVMDEHAKQQMLKEGFTDARIQVTGNPHFDHFADLITTDSQIKTEILFISQPVSDVLPKEEAGSYGYEEFDALNGIIRALKRFPGLTLSIRLHPKEKSGKFDDLCGPGISISATETLEDALSKAGLVIGMFSPVLIQAAAAGKAVVSFEPGLSGEDPLPTNTLGITSHAYTEEALQGHIQQYLDGTLITKRNIRTIWPQGATERVLAVLDSVAQNTGQ